MPKCPLCIGVDTTIVVSWELQKPLCKVSLVVVASKLYDCGRKQFSAGPPLIVLWLDPTVGTPYSGLRMCIGHISHSHMACTKVCNYYPS